MMFNSYLQISVNGHCYARYHHRIKPEEVTHFRIHGDVEPKSVIYQSRNVSSMECFI